MKKLKLKSLELGATEVLTREQLKSVLGGDGSGSGGVGSCTSDADCSDGKDINCNGTIKHSGPGRCYDSGTGKKCHYSVAC